MPLTKKERSETRENKRSNYMHCLIEARITALSKHYANVRIVFVSSKKFRSYWCMNRLKLITCKPHALCGEPKYKGEVCSLYFPFASHLPTVFHQLYSLHNTLNGGLIISDCSHITESSVCTIW